MKRQEILEIIKRTAEENGGIPLGEDRLAEIGLKPTLWGKYWPRLSAAQCEAGLKPNTAKEAHSEHDAMTRLAVFTRELGRLPTSRERIVRHNEDPAFPSERVWKRLDPRERLAKRLIGFAESQAGFEDIPGLCTSDVISLEKLSRTDGVVVFGTVYMIKGQGTQYKIGKTNAFGRRHRELAIQLPFDTRKIHVIETDDPDGVEAY